jgi:hypothetical protein
MQLRVLVRILSFHISLTIRRPASIWIEPGLQQGSGNGLASIACLRTRSVRASLRSKTDDDECFRSDAGRLVRRCRKRSVETRQERRPAGSLHLERASGRPGRRSARGAHWSTGARRARLKHRPGRIRNGAPVSRCRGPSGRSDARPRRVGRLRHQGRRHRSL